MTIQDLFGPAVTKPLRVDPMPPPPDVMLTAALAWQAFKFSVVRVRTDGSKAPAGTEWTSARQAPATEERVRAWFTGGHPGLGIVCGAVSGNLEMFELEGRAMELQEQLKAALRPELWQRLSEYRERSPSGGLHLLYRVEGMAVPGNLKLARRPATQAELGTFVALEHRKADDLPPDKRAKRMAELEKLTPERLPKVQAETRGEGGFVVVAPSGGRVHPTGGRWTLEGDSRPGVVPTITAEERAGLMAAARSLDTMPVPRPARPRAPDAPLPDGQERPGDAFERSVSWVDVLEPHGWSTSYSEGAVTHWTRPGKRWGTSATTNHGGSDRLYVFTSSTVFEAETSYSKFGAYAVLEHDGDYNAAATELRRQGYGTDRPAPVATAQRLAEAQPPAAPDGSWEPPLPLGPAPVPPLPVDALPPVLREFVTAVAASTQTPVDVAGVLAILAMATACAGKYRVHLRDDWSEPVNLYALVALPPGSRKSSVFKSAVAPLVQAERDLMAREAPVVRAAEQRQRILEQRAKEAERKAVQAGDPAKLADAEAADLALWSHVVPPAPRLLADDVTPEQLVTLLADHVCLGLLSEEGGIFETLAGRYSGGVANLDAVLKAWDGGSIRVDRRGSAPRQVEDPALTLGLAVQPAVLSALSKVPDMSGRGLLARFLYSVPDLSFGDVRVGARQIDPPQVPADVRTRYEGLVHGLAMAPRPAKPVALILDDAARCSFQTFRGELEPRRNPDTGDLADVVDWSGKLEGLTARLAGLLHLARNTSTDAVAQQDMAGAIALARYAIPHAKAAYDLMAGRSRAGAADSLLRAITAKGLREFSVRELHRIVEGQVRFYTVEGVQAGLTVLVEAGYVRAVPMPEREGPGRPPSPRYEVNPCVVSS